MNSDDPRPLAQFQRVAEVIRERVRAGEYPVGSQLPSVGALAGEFGCSHMTIKQAIATLSSEGVVASRKGVRAEVVALPNATPQASLAERVSRVERQVDALEERMVALEDHASKSNADSRSKR